MICQWPVLTIAVQGSRFEVLGKHWQCDCLPNCGGSAYDHDAFMIEITAIVARMCQILQIFGKAVGRVIVQIEDLLAKLRSVWVSILRTLFEELHITPFIG